MDKTSNVLPVAGIPFHPDMFPGYAEAVEKEQRNRAASFIDANQNIHGFKLRPMTLRDFDALRFLRNPLIFHGLPSMTHLADFLLLLNPSNMAQDKAEARKVMSMLKSYYEPSQPILRTAIRLYFHHQRHLAWFVRWSELVAALHGFVDEAFMDSPGFSQRKEKSYYCDIAGIVDMFASEYGWTVEYVLSLPLKRAFQLQRAILQRKGCRTLSNKSEDVIGEAVTKGIKLPVEFPPINRFVN